MTIQKLFRFSGMTNRAAIKTTDGNYFAFNISPAREITEEDLIPIPYYVERGKRAEEAPQYMYDIYHLKKEKKIPN